MRAVWRLVALGRAGLPDAASAATSPCAGFAFFAWGLPGGFPSAPACGAFGFFSSAIPCLYLSHGFGLLLLPVREEINSALSQVQGLLLQRGPAVLAYARVAVAVFLMTHPHRTRARGAHQHHVADGNRALLLGNAALDVLLRVGPHVLFHHHHVLHQHLRLVRHDAEHAAFLALVAPGNHPHLIVAANIYAFLHLSETPEQLATSS